MEDGTFILLAVIIGTFIALGFWLFIRDRAEERRERRRRTAPALAARHAPTASGEVGAWLPALLDQFDIDPDVLLEDEMPEELVRIMPLVKGFLKSGGLEKLIGGGQPPPGSEGESSEV